MEFSVVRVDKNNYYKFDDMVFCRINGRERNEDEKNEVRDFNAIYATLENENLYIYAAQSENIFVGWISIVYIPKVGRTNGKGHMFIDELWVNPIFRKKGIANALMMEADNLSKKLNTLGLRLYVSADNIEAISLYKKCGYSDERETFFMEKNWLY